MLNPTLTLGLLNPRPDHCMIQALTAALGISLRIAYLDGKKSAAAAAAEGGVGDSDGGKGKAVAVGVPVDFVVLDEGDKDGLPPIELLYRCVFMKKTFEGGNCVTCSRG